MEIAVIDIERVYAWPNFDDGCCMRENKYLLFAASDWTAVTTVLVGLSYIQNYFV